MIIPLPTMLSNIERRIAFLRARGDWEDMVAVDRLEKMARQMEKDGKDFVL